MKLLSKIKIFILLLATTAGVGLMQSCTEDIDTSDRYTFTGNTIQSYLESYPETYSEYLALLDLVNISDFSSSKVSQLLTARGNYTCFAPTNEAINNYLVLLKDSGVISEASWNAPEFQEINPETNRNDLLTETRKTIVYNSLIDAGDNQEAYQTSDFSERAEDRQMLGLANMMNRKLQVSKGNGTKYAINGCNVSDTNCDIYTINGRIHQVDKVIAPSTQTASQYFQKVIEERTLGMEEGIDRTAGIYTMACLLDACGLMKELDKTEDEDYYNAKMRGDLKDLKQHPTFKGTGGPTPKTPGTLPERRYYGYTIFTEKDSWWEEKLGLNGQKIREIAPDEVVKLVAKYVQDNNLVLSTAIHDEKYTDENNSLNQFVTYHILPAKIEHSKLVIHFNELYYSLDAPNKQASVFDYYTTMGKRRLLKTYEASNPVGGTAGTVYLNRFPVLDNGTKGRYTEIADPKMRGVGILVDDNPETYNTYIYKLDDCLYFNDDIAMHMSQERIRIDASTMFKELMSNDIRANENFSYQHQCVGMPQDVNYRYLDDCEISENTYFYYLTGRINKTTSWQNYQGDEINIVGNYEVTMKLPPVPRTDTYELRIGVSANDRRGMCQIYFGENKGALPAAGIPMDMRMGGVSWHIKGGGKLESIVGWEEDGSDEEVNAEIDKKMRNNGYMKAPNSYYMYGDNKTMRSRNDITRRIVLKQELQADKTYYIQFKSVLDDPDTEFFLDYIEYCPKSIYDNPETPEDIW